MKKLILIIFMALASSLAFAQSSSDKTLYIIDGVVSTKAAADELPSETIKNMNVVKGVESVVIITTHAGREISGRVVDVEGKPMAGVLVMIPKSKAGVATDANGYYKINLAAGEAFLNYMYVDYPTMAVQVDKTNMDDVVMDKKAPNNLVVIKDLKGDVISVRGEKMPKSDPLYLVKSANGDIKRVDNLESISPNDIKAMNVFKGDKGEQFKKYSEQFKKYGDTSNGVILVELK
ncbi:MAG: carboxypeptidase-like regulatory domain-containing protein [Bacteroidales bacterium]|nr:carboxypeptidase-like regulatory domain-containing protein [Bacteroidales bacterium]